MPTFHKKCDECGALLEPRGPDVKESWLHEPKCSRFEKWFEYECDPVKRLCCNTRGGEEHTKECAFARYMRAKWEKGDDLKLDDKWQSKSGATSSEKVPPFHLIPFDGLCALALRFGLGEKKHGRDNYRRACGTPFPPPNFAGVSVRQDIVWMEDRINHGILHALKWLLEMEGYLPRSGDDHAGAVAWLGTIMKEFERGNSNPSA